MALSDYLQPANAGKQMWQMLSGNMTRGDHPWNFVGVCQALVSQCFVELRFANGRPPEELGRYLVQGDLGQAGYNNIFKIQGSNMALDTQSGATVSRQTGIGNATPVDSGATLGMVMLGRLRGVDEHAANGIDDILAQIQVNHAHAPAVLSFQLSIHGAHGWLVSKIFGDRWGHAIGIHCNGVQLFVFDPNAGVYIIDPGIDQSVTGFFNDLWASYAPTGGSLDPIVHL